MNCTCPSKINIVCFPIFCHLLKVHVTNAFILLFNRLSTWNSVVTQPLADQSIGNSIVEIIKVSCRVFWKHFIIHRHANITSYVHWGGLRELCYRSDFSMKWIISTVQSLNSFCCRCDDIPREGQYSAEWGCGPYPPPVAAECPMWK